MKSSVLFFCSLFFALSVNAQLAPEIDWQKCIGSVNNDYAKNIIQTAGGNFVIVGVTSDGGDIDCSGSYEGYWLSETDSLGNIMWQHCYGGSNTDYLNSFIPTSDGGFLLTGSSQSSDGDVGEHYGVSTLDDWWIVKTDSIGEIEWTRVLGGTAIDIAYAACETASGEFIITGKTLSNNNDVSGNHNPLSDDTWVVKLDVAGNLIWQKCLGGNLQEYGNCIISTADGGCIITSQAWSSDGDVSLNHGSSDFWIVRLDSTANIVWEKSFGGGSNEAPISIIQTSDNNYLIAGYTQSYDGDISLLHGILFDVWVIKIDPAGNLIWEKTYGGTSYDFGYSIAKSPDGKYFITCITTSEDEDVTGLHGDGDYEDIWIIKIDDDANLIWQKCMGGTADEESFSSTITNDNGLMVFGTAYSTDGDVVGIHGDFGYADLWMVKLACDDLLMGYADMDMDGFGNLSDSIIACTTLPGYVYNHSDCNDSDPFISPVATEICNAFDDNCNGIADEGLPVNLFYADADADNYGNILSDSVSCFDTIAGFVSDNTDCDDLNAAIYPGAPEIEDGLDNNCNDTIDEGFTSIGNIQAGNYFKIFPNPAHTNIRIEITSAQSTTAGYEIEIFNILGEMVLHISNLSLERKEFLDIAELNPGLYSINLITGGQKFTNNLIVE